MVDFNYAFADWDAYVVGIYLLKVNNRKTKTWREICSKLKIKTPERCHQRWSLVFIKA